ncbi:MAG TPA: endonuclease/exonuclease/phosphatase family protein [Blastocatellia bacterium]|nr:endonuclease/exonuclease/phosphatase family protein [Blastocatellia bacterium]
MSTSRFRRAAAARAFRCGLQKTRAALYFSLLYIALFHLILAAPASTYTDTGSSGCGPDPLLETGSAPTVEPAALSPATIKIVSYNIRYRAGDDLRKLTELFKTDAEIGQAAILGLQEVDRRRKRTRNTNTAREMAEALGFHYAWAAPPLPPGKKDDDEQEEETGVAILSCYPLTDICRIVLPHPGPGGRRRVALGATVRIGETPLRVYSVHAETRISAKKRLEQFAAILSDLKANHATIERAVVLGDFNTWQPSADDETIRFFREANFTTPFPNGEATFKRYFFVKFKLDWVWLRGLEAVRCGIDREIGLSDHWPLWVEVRL